MFSHKSESAPVEITNHVSIPIHL